MRVLHLIDGLAAGGAETSLAEIAGDLISRGVELHVGYFADRRDVEGRLNEAGATTWPMVDATSRRRRVVASRQLLQRLRPDVVHTTLYEADIAGRAAARWSGVPVISSIVNEMYGERQVAAGVPVMKLRAAQAVDMATARFVDRFHAISHTVADVMAPRLRISPSKIEVIYRGRDPLQLGEHSVDRRNAVRNQLGLSETTPFVLGVGRLEPQKGFETLLAATATLRTRHSDLKVMIAGRDGNAAQALRAQISDDQLDDVVHLLGRRDDVADLMVAADVLAFTSHWEGFGGTVVEAMAVECPIVCSDLPVLREVIGPTAQFVTDGDSAALAASLDDVLTQPRDHARLAAARETFLSRYTTNSCAEQTVAMYGSVLRS